MRFVAVILNLVASQTTLIVGNVTHVACIRLCLRRLIVVLELRMLLLTFDIWWKASELAKALIIWDS